MKRLLFGALLTGLSVVAPSQAEDYLIDTAKAHASINFRIQHIGFSWLYGRFNDFEGRFSFDAANPEAASVTVTIDTASIDTNFAERDKHLRDERYLHVDKYPEASFVSTGYTQTAQGKGVLQGNFTFYGTTRPMQIEVEMVGAGEDPWGGYRSGFHGTTSFKPGDYGMDISKLGPASQEVFLTLSIEGIRQ